MAEKLITNRNPSALWREELFTELFYFQNFIRDDANFQNGLFADRFSGQNQISSDFIFATDANGPIRQVLFWVLK